MQSALTRLGNLSIAIFIPSILFGLIHLGNSNISTLAIVNTILAGLVFALFTHITKNLYFAIGFHTAWNFVQSSILGLPVSGTSMEGHQILVSTITGSNFISGGNYGVEGGIICSTVFIITIILQFLYIKRKA